MVPSREYLYTLNLNAVLCLHIMVTQMGSILWKSCKIAKILSLRNRPWRNKISISVCWCNSGNEFSFSVPFSYDNKGSHKYWRLCICLHISDKCLVNSTIQASKLLSSSHQNQSITSCRVKQKCLKDYGKFLFFYMSTYILTVNVDNRILIRKICLRLWTKWCIQVNCNQGLQL